MPDDGRGPRSTEVTFSRLLTLDDRGDGRYLGICHEGAPARAFGGQVAAQAFAAAAATAPDQQTPVSLHAYFAKAGTAGEPIEYRVERTGDGHSLSTRSVTAVQRGRTVLLLMASFGRPEEGPARQRTPAALSTPPAEPAAGPPGQRSVRERAVEVAPASADGAGQEPGTGYYARWMRARSAIGDDPALQACAIIYMADMVLARAVLQPHLQEPDGQESRSGARAASLDHSVWFHREIRADEWLLLEATSPVLDGSRGLAFAHIYSESGVLVATAAQEIQARQLG